MPTTASWLIAIISEFLRIDSASSVMVDICRQTRHQPVRSGPKSLEILHRFPNTGNKLSWGIITPRNESYNQKRGFQESPGGKVCFLFVISECGMTATLMSGSEMGSAYSSIQVSHTFQA